MTEPRSPAGDFDYDTHGRGYGHQRRTDPRLAAYVNAALGDADRVVNVGAGTGSYEPDDRPVVAVEPSAAMRSQRPPHRAPAVDARAEALPFADDSFGAAMAMMTIHQWPDVETGLRELRRVSRGPVVVLTFDAIALSQFWLTNYVPELVECEQRRFPPVDRMRHLLGGATTVTNLPIPIDCVDGFIEAFYGRPERLLDPAVRASQSAWGFLEPTIVDRAIGALGNDLASGQWDDAYGALRSQAEYTGALRLITAHPATNRLAGLVAL
jgi:SAM-dependent methyltransferase